MNMDDQFRRQKKDLLVKQGENDNWGSITEKSIRKGNNRIYKSRDKWILEKKKEFSDFKTAYRTLRNTQKQEKKRLEEKQKR